jgi:hypothetical protein
MTVPTRVECEKVITGLLHLNGAELSCEADVLPIDRISKEATRPFAIDLLRDLDSLLTKKYADVKSLNAWKWFQRQPAALSKMRKASRRTKSTERLSDEEYIECTADRLLMAFDDATDARGKLLERYTRQGNADPRAVVAAELARRNSREAKIDAFRRAMYLECQREYGGWERGAMIALRDYYYTDRWEQLYIEARSKEEELKVAIAGLAAIERLSTHLRGRVHRVAGSAPREIKEQLATEFHLTYPIRRKDGTARERTLVFDLYENNLNFRREKCTAWIADVMMSEGIANPLDSRTVERLIAGWEQNRKTYRQKIVRYTDLSAGAGD